MAQLVHAALTLLLSLLLVSAPVSAAQLGIDLPRLDVSRSEQAVWLDFETRFELPGGVEDALQKGVALYFVADAEVFRPRWYWRDKRVAQARRTWRLSYQPLTFSYRVSLGGLSQTYATLGEAMRSLQRLSQWRVADSGAVDENDYIEFAYRLDVDQLPRPLLITIGNQPEWSLRVTRTVSAPAEPR